VGRGVPVRKNKELGELADHAGEANRRSNTDACADDLIAARSSACIARDPETGPAMLDAKHLRDPTSALCHRLQSEMLKA